MSKAKKTIIIDDVENPFAFLNSFKPYDKHNARNGKHKVYAKLTNHRQKQFEMADEKTHQVNVPEAHVTDDQVPLTKPVEVLQSESKINQSGFPKNRKTAKTTATQAMSKDKCCNETTSTFVNPCISMKTHVPYVKDILAMKKLNEATANLNSALMQARQQLENSNLQDSIDVVKTLLATVNENEEVFNNNMSNIQNIAKEAVNVSKTKFENKKIARNNDVKSPRAVNQSADVLSKNVINIHDMAKNKPYEPKTEFKNLEVHRTNYIESPRQVNESDIELHNKLVNIEDIAKNSIYAPKKGFENKSIDKRNNIESPKEVNKIDEVIRRNMVKVENIEKSCFLGPKIKSTKKKVYREFYKESPRGVNRNDEAVAKDVSNMQNIAREKHHAPKIESTDKRILKRDNILTQREVNEIDEIIRKNMVKFQSIEKSSFLGPKIESTKKKVYREFNEEAPRGINKNDETVTKNISNIHNIRREKHYKNESILKGDNIESPREVNEIDEIIRKNMVNFPNFENSSFLGPKIEFTKKKVYREFNEEAPRGINKNDETVTKNISNIQNIIREKHYKNESILKRDNIESPREVNEIDEIIRKNMVNFPNFENSSFLGPKIESTKKKVYREFCKGSPRGVNKNDGDVTKNMSNIQNIIREKHYAPKIESKNESILKRDNIESPREVNEIDEVIRKNMVNFPNFENSSFLGPKIKFAKKKVQRDYNIELSSVESDETDENIGKEKLYTSEIEDEEVYKKDNIELSENERDIHIEEKKLFATKIDTEKRNIFEKISIDPPGALNKSDAMLSDNMGNIHDFAEKNIYAPKTEFRNKEVNERDNIESPRAIEYLNTLFAAMEKADKAKRKFKGTKSRNRRHNNFAGKTFSSSYKRSNLEKSAIKLKRKLRQVLNKKPNESLSSSSDSDYDTANSGLNVNKPKESMFCCPHHAGVKRYLKENKIMNNGKLFHIISNDKMEPTYKNVGTNCTYLDFKELYKPMVNTAKSVCAGKKLNDLFAQIEEGKVRNQTKDRKHSKAKDINLNWINKQLHFNYMCENCLDGSDNSFNYE